MLGIMVRLRKSIGINDVGDGEKNIVFYKVDYVKVFNRERKNWKEVELGMEEFVWEYVWYVRLS